MGTTGGRKKKLVSVRDLKKKDINFEGQNDDSWLFSAEILGTMKKERGSPFQRLHAVPINSCENSDGSCMPHEVIPQAWMENIGLTSPTAPTPHHKADRQRTPLTEDEDELR